MFKVESVKTLGYRVYEADQEQRETEGKGQCLGTRRSMFRLISKYYSKYQQFIDWGYDFFQS